MADLLQGTWALVATEWRRSDGRHANPFGAGAVGILIYDGAGNMSAQVMRADREPAAGNTGIDTAMGNAFPGYIAYFGEYDVDEMNSTVRHRVVGAAFPAWVGNDVVRGFRLDGNTLTLTDNVVSADGVEVFASTTWQRIA
jgi:hypothetical protein